MPNTLDLTALGTSTTHILTQLRRATRARYRYVFSCTDQGKHVDVPVDHQLTNHMLLLHSLAELAGVSTEAIYEATHLGVVEAANER